MNNTTQYPWRTRIGWECGGCMFYVDVCESECLDVAQALWLTGAEYIVLYIRTEVDIAWTFNPENSRVGKFAGYTSIV